MNDEAVKVLQWIFLHKGL